MAIIPTHIPSPGNVAYITTENQRKSDRNALAAAKTFGHIPDVPIGTHCPDRAGLHHKRIHRGLQTAIFGDENGAYSIILHGKFVADKDHGDSFTFRGSVSGSAALEKSFDTGYPVRVVRGYAGAWPGTPSCGYRYDGLYTVDLCWKEQGKTGPVISLFHFKRNPNQAPIDDSYSKEMIDRSAMQNANDNQGEIIATEEESEEEEKNIMETEIGENEGLDGGTNSQGDIQIKEESDDETIPDEDEIPDNDGTIPDDDGVILDDDETIPDENGNDYYEELFYGDV